MNLRNKIKEYIAMVTTDSSLGGVAFDGIMELIEKEKITHQLNVFDFEIKKLADHWIIKQKQNVESLEKDLRELCGDQEREI